MTADNEVAPPPRRMPAWMTSQSGEPLTVERQRLRVAAYIYGNILVLAAIAVATGSSIDSGYATLVVAVTTVTTFLAHVIAQNVGQQLGREPGAHRPHALQELRDALPILFSGIVPAAILILGDIELISSEFAQLGAALWVVGRLSLMGFLVERLSGRRPTWRTLSGGIGLAMACAAIVVVKVLFAH